MSDTPIIEERENGPLVVKAIPRLRGAAGDPLDTKEVMALCRCGHSKNKPFCDGTHKDVGFESRGGTPAGRNRLIAYEGQDLTVTYNPLLCSHAAECGRLAPRVFDPNQKPWVQPDNASVAEVRAVVAACPSGALALASDGTEHVIGRDAGIDIEKDGPYWVTGIAPPQAQTAEGAAPDKYVLCRCGLSGNKPYCDGTHRDAGWTDSD